MDKDPNDMYFLVRCFVCVHEAVRQMPYFPSIIPQKWRRTDACYELFPLPDHYVHHDALHNSTIEQRQYQYNFLMPLMYGLDSCRCMNDKLQYHLAICMYEKETKSLHGLDSHPKRRQYSNISRIPFIRSDPI